MKTILITGINGFLGSNLAKVLSDEYSIIGLEYTLENLNRLKDHNFKVYCHKDKFEAVFDEQKIDIIIHTATVYRNDNESIEKLLNTNVILPLRLFELANKYSVEAFLNTDTFFNNPQYDYPYLGEYSLSKKHCLEWLKTMKGKTKLINMKLFHMYGPNDSKNKFVTKILSDLKKHSEEIKLTEGEQKRDFIFIADVVSAFKTVADNINCSKNLFTEYQVGTGKLTSIRNFVEIAAKITESKSNLLFGVLPYRKGEIMLSVADITGLKKLNWFPKYTIEKGLYETSTQ